LIVISRSLRQCQAAQGRNVQDSGLKGKAIDDGSTGTKRKAPMLCLQTQAALRIVLKDSYHGNLGAM
jgi:hypothetical protein